MRVIIEVMNTSECIIHADMPGLSVFSICGCNQPARDLASEWIWDGNPSDSALIYVSTALSSEGALDALAPILERFKNAQALLDQKSFNLLDEDFMK